MTSTQKSEIDPLVAGDGFEQIGSTLKAARLSHGRSIRDISEQLRISVDFLTKLEAGAFNELPAPAYVTGFLRSYGRSVGLAPDQLVARYMDVTKGKDSTPSYKTPMSTRPPQRSAPAVASMLVLFALMAYGGWFWLKTNSLSVLNSVETDIETAALLHSSDHEGTPIGVVSRDQPATKDMVVDKLAEALDEPTAMSFKEKTTELSRSGLDTSKGQVTDEPMPDLAPNDKTAVERAGIGPSAVQARASGQVKTDLALDESQIFSLPKAEMSNRALPDELVKTQILAVGNSSSVDLLNSNGAIAKLRDPAKEITIRAVAASWVEIVRDNGEEVLAKLMQVGDSYVVEGNTRLFLSTGNAGGLTVVIGKDDPLSMGDIGEIVRDLPLVTDELRKSL
mgnify:CR=1 FL=1